MSVFTEYNAEQINDNTYNVKIYQLRNSGINKNPEKTQMYQAHNRDRNRNAVMHQEMHTFVEYAFFLHPAIPLKIDKNIVSKQLEL